MSNLETDIPDVYTAPERKPEPIDTANSYQNQTNNNNASVINRTDFAGPPTAQGFGLGMRYLCTPQGVMKVLEMAFSMLLMICVGVYLYSWVDRGSAWVAMCGLGVFLFAMQVTLGFMFDFFNETRPWGLLLCLPYFLWTIIFMINFAVVLAIVLHTKASDWGIIVTAVRGVAAFSFLLALVLSADGALYLRSYIKYRRSR